MKKHLKFIQPLLFVVLVSATLLPLQRVFADANADEQQGASDVGKAQAEAAAAASDLQTVQQCATGATQSQCQTSWAYAAANAANLASQYAADAANLANQDAPNAASIGSSLYTQIQANSAEASSAATAADKSSTQAATAAGETTTAQQSAAAAQQSAQASGASSGAAQQTSGTAAATPAATQSTGSNFVSLTDFPAVTAIANNLGTNADIGQFFAILYKICIGLAATLAVIQIIHAGLLWMGAGDNTESISKARNLIAMSVFGLILVLSPVIVFDIVNPQVLNLSLNFSGIQISTSPTSGAATPAATPAVTTPASGACNYDIDGYGVLPPGQTCATQYEDGDVTAPVTCCDNSGTPTPGAVCCGHPNP